jgi:hypothetical protein
LAVLLVNVPIWHIEYDCTFLLLTADCHHADCRMNEKVEVGGWCYERIDNYDYYSPASSRQIGGVICQHIIKLNVQHANNTVVQDFIHPVFLFGLYHAHHRINRFIWLIRLCHSDRCFLTIARKPDYVRLHP